MFVRLDLEQGSQPWLDWREGGLGASDALVVLGKSEYKTRWILWAEKLGIKKPADLSRNPHVRRGNYFEPRVRSTVSNALGKRIEVFCGYDDKHPWRKVSFDGIIDNSIPVEIKCAYSVEGEDQQSELSLEKLENSRYQDLVKNGNKSKLFREYESQIQYQIGMLDAPYGYFAFFFEKINQLKIIKVMRNQAFIDEIFQEVDKFYLEHIRPALPPVKDKDRDYYEPTEKELLDWDSEALKFIEVVEEERKLKARLKEIKSEKGELVESIMGKAHGFRQLALHALKITVVKGRATFDYKSFLDKKGIKISERERDEFSTFGKSSSRLSVIKDSNILEKTENAVIQHQKEKMLSCLFDGEINASNEDLEEFPESFFV